MICKMIACSVSYALCNVLTSISDIKFDSKVSSWATWTMACGEDDSTDGFYLPDDAGDRRGGKDPIVSNYQTSNLKSIIC